MIVGIVKIGSGIVPLEEFRPGDDVTVAISSFCSEQSPPLDPVDYFGIDGVGLDYGKQWGWDFANAGFVQIGWKEALVDSILEHKDIRLDTISLRRLVSSLVVLWRIRIHGRS